MNTSLSEREYCLALSCLRFLSPVRMRAIQNRFVSPGLLAQATLQELEHLLKLLPTEAALVKDPLQLPDVRREVDRTRDFVAWTDSDYPAYLKEIGDAPFALRFRGRRELLREPAIAIVGSRAASPYGKNVARYLADKLARSGIAVVSGLARGIDAEAHSAALDAAGSTIAILGTSHDIAYPRENARLMSAIAENGLLLTEFPDGTRASRQNFPVRNRLIAGISLGVVVVEAGERSGSLITARLAMEQGREVFAAPGSIFSPNSAGPHGLIQDGAKLLHSVDDLFEELRLVPKPTATSAPSSSEQASSLLDLLSFEEGTNLDTLKSATGLSFGSLAAALLELESNGSIDQIPGGRYVRRSTGSQC